MLKSIREMEIRIDQDEKAHSFWKNLNLWGIYFFL